MKQRQFKGQQAVSGSCSFSENNSIARLKKSRFNGQLYINEMAAIFGAGLEIRTEKYSITFPIRLDLAA